MTLLSWHRLARRLSGWLLAALLLGTLAPAISRALASGAVSGGAGWVELCTSEGMRWVRVSDAPSRDAPPAPSGAMDLCGHCTLAAERFAPLLPVLPVVAAVATTWATPVFRAHEPVTAPAPRPAARGPPCLN
ncbi:MAG: DUF2946 family protein [Hydrogenophaga sp.]|nr:DUF2946 family protein [Hydrogenophaga sp.]